MSQTYTKEFKLETLRLAEEIGPTQAARRLNVSASIIYRWRKEFKVLNVNYFYRKNDYYSCRFSPFC